MNTNSRITSVLKASYIDSSITGVETFHLSELKSIPNLDFELPTNIRLGHLVERIVAQLVKSSNNFKILYENTQIIDDKTTIGEIDFILQEKQSKEIIHLELAYKFYLLDPTISSDTINNWIGPNRNDSLKQKLEKLKNKQFPLLFDERTQERFNDIDVQSVTQKLCLLSSLYLPHDFKENIPPVYQKAIKGFYINYTSFLKLNHDDKYYFIPPKKEWGIDSSENVNWLRFNEIEEQIKTNFTEKQAPLCWQKHNDIFSEFFIVWW